MIDDHRVQQMAWEYSMNYSTARRLLENVRDVPALRIGRWYQLILAAAQIRMGFEKGIEAASEATEITARIRSIMTGGDVGGNIEGYSGTILQTAGGDQGSQEPD